MRFAEWNDLLSAYFFRQEMAGRGVFLFVTEDVLNRLGESTGSDWHDFVASAIQDAAQAGGSFCGAALRSYEGWRGRNLASPPYIAHLGLLVLAAGLQGDFAPHAYYPRLRAMLGMGGAGMLSRFDDLWELWADLEQWASSDRHGELGVFKYRIAGGMDHVGAPLAQTLLTEQERGELPVIFYAAGLDPAAPPSDATLLTALNAHAQRVLRPRTATMLARHAGRDDEMLGLLLSSVRDELETWNGESPVEEQPTVTRISGGLRLCLKLDRVARCAAFTVRCSLRREFPDGGLQLALRGGSVHFRGDGDAANWSTPLIFHEGGAVVDGATLGWSQPVELVESTFGWRFRWRGSPVRLFTSGMEDGLPGYVEVHQLQSGAPFLLAVEEASVSRIRDWGQASCVGFSEVPIDSGLPRGWRMFASAQARSDDEVRQQFPVLALGRTARMLLRGGVRGPARNSYFEFWLPRVVVEGGRESDEVRCQDVALVRLDGAFALPRDLPKGVPVLLTLHRDGSILERERLLVLPDFEWRRDVPTPLLDRFGQVGSATTMESGVTGALTLGVDPGPAVFAPPARLVDGDHILLVGPIPGQVASWPEDSLPSEWQPTWSIIGGRDAVAHYCGTDVSAAAPQRVPVTAADRRRIRQWKEILFHRRKRTEPPNDPRLRRLWRSYVEAARAVRA